MILLNDPEAIRLISHAAKVMWHPTADRCMASSENGEITGGVIYTDYNYVSIQMHVAGFKHNWGGRALLYYAFDYPFNKLGVKKIFALVPEINEKALAFDKNLGFTEETRVRDLFPEGDAIVLSMHRDQCRWLKMRPPKADFRMTVNGW